MNRKVAMNARLIRGGAVLGLCLLATEGVATAHLKPTHRNITRIAVDYLSKVDDRFACISTLNDLLQVGAAAEDDIPRFMFHFYPALSDGRFFASCSSRQWAFGNAACSQSGGEPAFSASTLTNTHTWNSAITHADSSQGWTDLGYVLHLLEDLTSPAHTRNDSHPAILLDGDPVEAFDRTPTAPAVTDGLVSFATPEKYFDALQEFTRTNFYSKDTVFQAPGPAAASSDNSYFYDARHRRIAYKGPAYWLSGLSDATRDPQQATINETIADDQFAELGPVAVKYVASLIRHYFDAASPQMTACFIDFEKFTGGSIFTTIQPPLKVESATISGGQILSNATNLPRNHTTVYGTAFFCNGCLPTLTIDFAHPAGDVSLLLMNGQTFTVDYTVTNNLGDLVTLSLAANLQSGAGIVHLPAAGVSQVTITSSTGSWDFLVDNIGFH